jgi:hypothetical protein
LSIEAPQSFVVRQEGVKATWQNGFRRALGEHAGWAAFASTTARGKVYLAAAGKAASNSKGCTLSSNDSGD